MNIRIAGVVRESIVDGPGLRFTVFTQGCPHNCEGCHNKQTHDFNGGYITTTEKIIAEYQKNPFLKGITFSGGEPTHQARECAEIGKAVKALGGDVVIYSGYTYEELLERSNKEPYIDKLLQIADILVDGKFILAKKDLSLKFRGSSNQRVIDLNETRENNAVSLFIHN